jgi:hypothetical protein
MMDQKEPVWVYETHTGGLVLVYSYQSFFIVTFDDTSSEIEWGRGASLREALINASREWGDEDNPFDEALASLDL